MHDGIRKREANLFRVISLRRYVIMGIKMTKVSLWAQRAECVLFSSRHKYMEGLSSFSRRLAVKLIETSYFPPHTILGDFMPATCEIEQSFKLDPKKALVTFSRLFYEEENFMCRDRNTKKKLMPKNWSVSIPRCVCAALLSAEIREVEFLEPKWRVTSRENFRGSVNILSDAIISVLRSLSLSNTWEDVVDYKKRGWKQRDWEYLNLTWGRTRTSVDQRNRQVEVIVGEAKGVKLYIEIKSIGDHQKKAIVKWDETNAKKIRGY